MSDKNGIVLSLMAVAVRVIHALPLRQSRILISRDPIYRISDIRIMKGRPNIT